ncbi:MAG: hypothetical protein P8Y53_23925, partial [Pseudolabrys sp.]
MQSNVQQRHNRNPRGEHADSRPHGGDLFHEAGGASAAGLTAAPEFEPPAAVYEGKSAASESRTLLRALWHSTHRMRVVLLAGGIAAVLIANM